MHSILTTTDLILLTDILTLLIWITLKLPAHFLRTHSANACSRKDCINFKQKKTTKKEWKVCTGVSILILIPLLASNLQKRIPASHHQLINLKMVSSISPGKQGNVGKGDCSALCQLWVSIKSQCACQQFLHRSSKASTLPGIGKENHLPISNLDLSLSISHLNTGMSLLCSQRTCKFQFWSLCSRYHLKFILSLCVLISAHICTPLLPGGGDFSL